MIKTVVQKVKSHLYKKFKLNIKNKVEEEILIQLKDQVLYQVVYQVEDQIANLKLKNINHENN